MNGTFRLGEIGPLRYFAVIGLLTGITFGLITSEEGVVETAFSVIQWTLQASIGIFAIVLCHMLLLRSLMFERLDPWRQLIVSGIAGAVVFAPVALAIDLLIIGEEMEAASLGLELVDEFMALVIPMCLVWVAINAPFALGFQLVREAAGPASTEIQPGTEPVSAAPFMQLVDTSVRGDVIYMKAELHYVLVVTDKGKDLILYSLKDAIQELGNDDGFQSHRSWWVNPNYVDGFRRAGRQGELTLSTGDAVPVSRSQLSAAETRFAG